MSACPSTMKSRGTMYGEKECTPNMSCGDPNKSAQVRAIYDRCYYKATYQDAYYRKHEVLGCCN